MFEKLKFVKNNATFKDGRKALNGFVKGSFTQDQIKQKLQSISNGLFESGKKNAYVAVSIHYKNPDDWLPAIYNKVGNKIKIFNPNDSDTSHDYTGIDGAYFYIVELPENSNMNQKMHKVKKASDDTSMFTKHKK